MYFCRLSTRSGRSNITRTYHAARMPLATRLLAPDPLEATVQREEFKRGPSDVSSARDEERSSGLGPWSVHGPSFLVRPGSLVSASEFLVLDRGPGRGTKDEGRTKDQGRTK